MTFKQLLEVIEYGVEVRIYCDDFRSYDFSFMYRSDYHPTQFVLEYFHKKVVSIEPTENNSAQLNVYLQK